MLLIARDGGFELDRNSPCFAVVILSGYALLDSSLASHKAKVDTIAFYVILAVGAKVLSGNIVRLCGRSDFN